MSRIWTVAVACALALNAALSIAAEDRGPTESERRHVPPDPPQQVMQDMSAERMIELMQMEDDASLGMVRLDRFEWRATDDGDALSWDAEAWYGNDRDKAVLSTEGERIHGDHGGRAELLWDRVVGRWWQLRTGVRHDFAAGPSRTWAAFGVHGLAPYRFEVEANAYVGEQGRTALRLSGAYELLITQRLILQPNVELDWYGKDDLTNGIGAGVADAELGFLMRYEIRREFAPYAGIVWVRRFGRNADIALDRGDDPNNLQFTVGLRAWF
jgi:copper resistance protein B